MYYKYQTLFYIFFIGSINILIIKIKYQDLPVIIIYTLDYNINQLF